MMEPGDEDIPDVIDYEVADSIDLHGFQPKDIAAVTRAYLEEVRKKRFSVVRIVHGKGIGVQREIVRKILAETTFVRKFRSGDEFSGGWGATIVEIQTD
jgi:Mismatch repair ATPase (MutS family)